eukprot:scaffold6844_cov173-Amphora_coffeaeformis.AAC.3
MLFFVTSVSLRNKTDHALSQDPSLLGCLVQSREEECPQSPSMASCGVFLVGRAVFVRHFSVTGYRNNIFYAYDSLLRNDGDPVARGLVFGICGVVKTSPVAAKIQDCEIMPTRQ